VVNELVVMARSAEDGSTGNFDCRRLDFGPWSVTHFSSTVPGYSWRARTRPHPAGSTPLSRPPATLLWRHVGKIAWAGELASRSPGV